MPELEHDSPLLAFITAARERGATDEFLVSLLRSRGWQERQVYEAFVSLYESQTGKMVPARGGRLESARAAFLYLLSFSMLATWATALGSLLFAVTDRYFPSSVDNFYYGASFIQSISYELAAILIAFPLYLLLMRRLRVEVESNPDRKNSPIRNWLTYLALFLAATIVVCDLVTFLAYFLRGDLTVRFVLKVAILLVIAGGVFSYYLGALRDAGRDVEQEAVRARFYRFTAIGVVIASLALGLVQVGAPGSFREAARDTTRVQRIYALAQDMHRKWQANSGAFQLPQELNHGMQYSAETGTDPLTKRGFEYHPGSLLEYQICGTFETESPSAQAVFWRHGAGRYCFTFDAKTEPVSPDTR